MNWKWELNESKYRSKIKPDETYDEPLRSNKMRIDEFQWWNQKIDEIKDKNKNWMKSNIEIKQS